MVGLTSCSLHSRISRKVCRLAAIYSRYEGIGITMPDALHDSSTELFLEDFSLEGDAVPDSLDAGQAIVVSGGALQGARGTVVKRSSRDQYLVELGETRSRFWVRLPAQLVRAV